MKSARKIKPLKSGQIGQAKEGQAMHYSVVKDAALYAAIAVAVTIKDSFSIEKMTACYLAIFLVILFCLEVARDWEERQKGR